MGIFNRIGKPNVKRLKKKGDVEGLINALEYQYDFNKDIRVDAVYALGEISDERAVKPLIAIITDEKENYFREADVERAAATALVRIGTPSVTPILAFFNDKRNFRRNLAADALGQIGDKRAVEPLITLLKARNSDVHREVESCLSIGVDVLDRGSGHEGYAKPEFKQFGEEHYAIIKALGKIGDQRAVEPIVDALIDPREEIRDIADRALDVLGWKGKLPRATLVEDCKDLIHYNCPSSMSCYDFTGGAQKKSNSRS